MRGVLLYASARSTKYRSIKTKIIPEPGHLKKIPY